jgi:hypothetical protein
MSGAPCGTGAERHGILAEKIRNARPRGRVSVTGGVVSSAPTRHGGSIACRVEIDDGTGTLALLFFGRGSIPGLIVGACVRVWGTALPDGTGLVIWNPRYEFVAPTRT